MTTITIQQAQALLPENSVHIFIQRMEGIGLMAGRTITRQEAEQLLSNAQAINLDHTIIDKHPVQHGISIKNGKGLIFFQTIPEIFNSLAGD